MVEFCFNKKPPKIHAKVFEIARILEAAGASEIFLVGGFVRDHLLGIRSKDFDLEVYGLDYEAIAAALKPTFRLNQVGKSFSVLKIDNKIDLALPRREVKTGHGHREFCVEADPQMTFAEAASRRDFTINAIGMRIDGTLCDPFDGCGDLRRGVLRAPTEAFCEDPLRVLRGMQFAARFNLDMEPRTVALCRRVLPEFATLSEERIFTEWWKWATKGDFPDKGLELLRETGWITCFPELAATVGARQNPKYHPEGDVFTHTKMVCTEAARLARACRIKENERAVLMFAALCHDFGKPITSGGEPEKKAALPEHSQAGVMAAKAFLMKMKPPAWLVEHVLPLVAEHMVHLPPKREAVTEAEVRHLADRLSPSNIRMWEMLCESDEYGRGGVVSGKNPPECLRWATKARQTWVYEQPPEPLLQGRHLLERGVKPGPGMGVLLRKAWTAQLDGAFTSPEEALRWLEEQLTGGSE